MKALSIIFISILVQNTIAYSQRTTIIDSNITCSLVSDAVASCGGKSADDFYTIVDEMPQFKYGEDSLKSYLTINNGCNEKGRIFISFIVLEDGTTCGHTVIRGLGEKCDALALKRFESISSEWIPGVHKNEKRKVAINAVVLSQ